MVGGRDPKQSALSDDGQCLQGTGYHWPTGSNGIRKSWDAAHCRAGSERCKELRGLIRTSEDLKRYEPSDTEVWDEIYEIWKHTVKVREDNIL